MLAVLITPHLRLLLAAAGMLLCSCASLLSGGLPLLQMAPAALGERTVEQRLTMQWPGDTRTLDVVASIDHDQLSLLGMALGVRLFALDYDGSTVHKVENVPMSLPAERMLNDFLIVYAPLDALRAALPADWAVNDSGRQRVLEHAGQSAIVVDYDAADRWNGHAVLRNSALHYQLIIDSAVAP
ncbi:hypothetical protein IGB42_01469 [Andreprevotia sp. IGB-42]|uniref:DUF3261 domain-containing protein n=1 Tax=Andreprevotia sp. IGB-42 TaxID=2497473 RepID=UPI001356B929|nr:DUF3261 domain-containing protein [Andreprevotia sp. IGB-42]KAF0813790.1 hypothetical protein IGB42_01469 [Andreprevotia sp. IGB-42]